MGIMNHYPTYAFIRTVAFDQGVYACIGKDYKSYAGALHERADQIEKGDYENLIDAKDLDKIGSAARALVVILLRAEADDCES